MPDHLPASHTQTCGEIVYACVASTQKVERNRPRWTHSEIVKGEGKEGDEDESGTGLLLTAILQM